VNVDSITSCQPLDEKGMQFGVVLMNYLLVGRKAWDVEQSAKIAALNFKVSWLE